MCRRALRAHLTEPTSQLAVYSINSADEMSSTAPQPPPAVPSPWRCGAEDGCQATSEIDPWLRTGLSKRHDGQVVHESIGGGPAPGASTSIAQRATARGGPVDPRERPATRCGTALSVSPKAARRLDAGQFVEIEIDNRPCKASRVTSARSASGCASSHAAYSACRFKSVATSGTPLLRSAGMAGRAWRAQRRRRAVVGLALAIASLALGRGLRRGHQHGALPRFPAAVKLDKGRAAPALLLPRRPSSGARSAAPGSGGGAPAPPGAADSTRGAKPHPTCPASRHRPSASRRPASPAPTPAWPRMQAQLEQIALAAALGLAHRRAGPWLRIAPVPASTTAAPCPGCRAYTVRSGSSAAADSPPPRVQQTRCFKYSMKNASRPIRRHRRPPQVEPVG